MFTAATRLVTLGLLLVGSVDLAHATSPAPWPQGQLHDLSKIVISPAAQGIVKDWSARLAESSRTSADPGQQFKMKQFPNGRIVIRGADARLSFRVSQRPDGSTRLFLRSTQSRPGAGISTTRTFRETSARTGLFKMRRVGQGRRTTVEHRGSVGRPVVMGHAGEAPTRYSGARILGLPRTVSFRSKPVR